jgi:WD40 repeat protein
MLIAPDSRLLVTAEADKTLRLWSLPKGILLKTLAGQATAVTTLAMSQDGKLLASGGQDGAVYLWNVDSRQLLRVLKGHQQPVTAIAISADASTLITGCKGGILHQWDLQTGEQQQTLKLAKNSQVTAAIYGVTDDGASSDRLVTASSTRTDTGSFIHQLQVWDLLTGRLRRTFAGHAEAIEGLHLTNVQTLFSFSNDGGMIWNLQREELDRVLPKDSANSIAVSQRGQDVVTVHTNGKVRIWTYVAGRLVKREEGRLGEFLNAVLSQDHHYLVSWSADQQLRIWQIKTAGS